MKQISNQTDKNRQLLVTKAIFLFPKGNPKVSQMLFQFETHDSVAMMINSALFSHIPRLWGELKTKKDAKKGIKTNLEKSLVDLAQIFLSIQRSSCGTKISKTRTFKIFKTKSYFTKLER